MELKRGSLVELKKDNEQGYGSKGERGLIKYELYRPVDGWEILVSFEDGKYEGFMKKDLMLAPKTISKFGGMK